MSSRPVLIAGIAAGVLAGVALFAVALAVVAIDGATLSGQVMALVVLGTMLGFVLDATWLVLAVERVVKLGRPGEDEDGGTGWSGPGPDPVRPGPPSEDLYWWPAFEREFRAYDEAAAPARSRPTSRTGR